MKSEHYKRDCKFGKVRTCLSEFSKQTDLLPSEHPQQETLPVSSAPWDEPLHLSPAEGSVSGLFTNAAGIWALCECCWEPAGGHRLLWKEV